MASGCKRSGKFIEATESVAQEILAHVLLLGEE
jgi:hypothetical protein